MFKGTLKRCAKSFFTSRISSEGNRIDPIHLSVFLHAPRFVEAGRVLVTNYGKTTFGQKDCALRDAGGVSMLGHFHF